VLLLESAIETLLPFPLPPRQAEKLPTGIVAITVLVAVLITDTVFEPLFVMSAFCARL
jgi:hypothetical protein